ncbi:PKHD1 like 1, tandem duplicate 1 [Alosa pseudoharengus]|uniref:PKHD1 like 1, tandem duplicate 1 n=1 Tax=Alosa pseudoharengus TaxID=34774 RepID=UPI003F8C928C
MMRTRRHTHLPLVVCLILCYSDAQRVFRIDPHIGSLNGATRITIEGEGFAQENQFSLNPDDADFGNSVTLVSKTRSIPCDVERDSTHSNQILCYTRAMPMDDYHIRVSVDGVPIPTSRMCNGWYTHYICSFYTRWWATPTIWSTSPSTGLPGSVITTRGRIYTDVYGSNTDVSTNGLNVRFLRAYMGGMPCELLKPNTDELYGLTMDSETSQWGYMSCAMTGTYIGHHNLSYILDSQYGRSLPENNVYFVSGLNKLSMFQTYAEVTGVSPSKGSVLGGTLLTIHGHHFDETDMPAAVTVGGQRCEVVSVTDDKIVCRTPEYRWTNMTVFPGGRGMKMELWNESFPRNLEDVMNYNSSRPDHQGGWVDSLTLTYPIEILRFVSKLTGFFVPMETDHYRFFIKGDDRYQLYFSLTGRPKDKVLIGYRTGVTNSFFSSDSQASSVMHLEKGKAYYLEALLQDWGGPGWIQVGVFKWKSPFTHEQAYEAVDERQVLNARYDVLEEKQVLRFDGWGSEETPVMEVQQVTVSSTCFSLGTCDSTFYTLGYGEHKTGPIAVSASADQVAAALNGLWSIKPDSVTVTKQDLGTEAEYTMTFHSNRGDFESLDSWRMGGDVNVSVTEVTKGVASLETFTLLWGGVPSTPISFNASEAEVRGALEAMLHAECPAEVLAMESFRVKYHRDYEDEHTGFSKDNLDKRGTLVMDTEAFCGRWSLMNPEILFMSSDTKESGGTYGAVNLEQDGTLCFAYKGDMKSEVGVKFSYKDNKGATQTVTAQVPLTPNQDPGWHYTCVDLMTSLQTKHIGTNYKMTELHLSSATVGEEYYVDAVHLGRDVTVFDNMVLQRRRPPALAQWGQIIDILSVVKTTEGSSVSYKISASPFNCAYGLPLMEVGFLQGISGNLSDSVAYAQGGAKVTVTRTQSASPPLNGTFDIEIYGRRVEGLPVDISAQDLKYALQSIPEMGSVDVTRSGDCKAYKWLITWLSNPGRQHVLQVNASDVTGVNPQVYVNVRDEGGLFMQSIRGDLLRVPESKPQVEVLINGIASKCSGDCSFEWSADKTPLVTGISPSQGSSNLGTVLTISGSGFDDTNATVWIGHTECTVTQVTDTQVTCSVGPAPAGTYPVILSLPGLGQARYQGDQPFNITSQLSVSSVSPIAGSLTGGTVLTVEGFGFGWGTEVTIGSETCEVLEVNLHMVTCRVPPGSLGAQSVTVTVGDMSQVASQTFNYSDGLTATITSISPQTTSVSGHRLLVVMGTNFGVRGNDTLVFVGQRQCEVVEWNTTAITCILPFLPPAMYEVNVQIGNLGFPTVSAGVNATVQYVLEVSSVTPLLGSLYGGSQLTISGSGFSANLEDNRVMLGDRSCRVTAASEHEIQCVVESGAKTHTITNQGSHPSHGEGYAWSPAAALATVGDSVVWRWEAPAFLQDVGFRVFSVASPSSTTPDGRAFTSGDAKTPSGFFRYQFTSPGVYYYSSGFVDSTDEKSLQGVVTVRDVEESRPELHVTVGGFTAMSGPAMRRVSRDVEECTTAPNCPEPTPSNGTSFSFSRCASPAVHAISPSSGHAHDFIHIQGMGFGSQSCAIEVMVGDHSCQVVNSTESEIYCQLSTDSGAEIGTPLPVTVRVNNLGTAINTAPSEFDRRFVVLPVVDSVSPSSGSVTGHTKLTITGSGFSESVAVTVDRLQCQLLWANYTTVMCQTSPSTTGPRSGSVVIHTGSIASACAGDCTFTYSAELAPQVFGVNPNTISGNLTTVVVNGTGFGSDVTDVSVHAADISLEVTDVTDRTITLSVGPLPAGSHPLSVVVMSRGLALGDVTLTSDTRATLSPNAGSTAGGTPLVLTGNGFLRGNTSVSLDGAPCWITEVTPGEVHCLTPPHNAAQVKVLVRVLGVQYPALTFSYSQAQTPKVTGVSPATGLSNTVISLTGTGFGSDASLISVKIDGVACIVATVTDTLVTCAVGEHAGGTFPIMLQHKVKGYATSNVVFNYELQLTGVVPSEGGLGGGNMVRVEGTGFDPRYSQVRICGGECEVNRNMSSSTQLHCRTPPINGSNATHSCPVTVVNGKDSVNKSDGYSYKSSLTPAITDVSPRRGGTAGGTRLTITGSGFSPNSGKVSVTIAGSVCDVMSANNTAIICVTNAQARSQETKVRVEVGDKGVALMDHADFFYIDVWSSRYTWGGLSPPEKGSFAVITKGQTILLDTSTPVLKMLLIQGGKLVFDEKDIELQAENILITDGGALQVGTEEEPFQHKAIITLHGDLRSPELPVYGAKTLGVREGVLDLHGIPVPVTWTRLAQTAENGSSTLLLTHPVTWKSGDQVVIATTGHRHSQKESEVRFISTVSSDGRMVALTEPLEYTHLGVTVTLPDGTEFEARAEVGLLTRNIVVRGSNNIEWNDKVEACPAGFNTGEFATQTCFQGRFGEETGSDQFGGCIMFHAPRPGENLAIGRIEHVELFNAGQAFRLGRYPIHWHLMGDVNFKSYVRGCALHQTYNRAVTIHNTHNLLVERNVIYNIMGGAFFIEDGIETGNVVQYNLAVFVRQSTSLLNDDVTPAAYWVTNPNNVIRHNAAAGGTHFGFWYRMHEHPDGPSYDPNICQKRVPLGEFSNNTVHSQGWFGLWIFKEYFPVKDGHCNRKKPEPAVFRSLTTWNCEKGAEWVDVGAVQFSGFVMVNNEKAGIEGKRIISDFVGDFGEELGAAVINSTLVGHVDELMLGDNYCSTSGVILPLDDGMSVISSTFMNFDRKSCAAIGVARIDGTCIDRCGGWGARFSGIKYYNSPNKASFRWEHEVNLIDLDGSLTGTVGSKVAPASPLLDPSLCTPHDEWSVGFPGLICDPSVHFHRLAFNHPKPTSLEGNFAVISNGFGASMVPYLKKRMTHPLGWMAMLPSGQTYNWYFNTLEQLTNISYDATFYGFKHDEFIIINHNLTQSPDSFNIMDKRNGSTAPLTNAANVNGDWYFNKDTKNVYYIISGKDSKSSRRRRSSVDPQELDRNVYFQVFNCFYPNCQAPTPPPPATLAPLPTGRPNDSKDWSNESFWKSSAENNFTVPSAGSNVVIPTGAWVVLNGDTPALNKLTVKGVLEIRDDGASRSRRSTPNKIVLDATYISIQGGRLIAGSEDKPFTGELDIVLRGDHYTPDWLLPNGPNQGSKVLGVFGTLELYGKPHNVYHSKLASTAEAGTNTLTLRRAVDWQVGDEVVISTTSYDPWQTEKRTIAAISDDLMTLTLSAPLTHTHLGKTYSISGSSRTYTLAADVGLLTRNIKIIGHAHAELYSQSFGARVLVGTFSDRGIDYRGKAQIRNVEFYHTGQEGWSDYSDPRYSVAFLNLGEVSHMESYIQGCGFHDGFSPAIGIFGTNGMQVDDNVIYFTVGEGIRVWGSNNMIRRNLVTMTLWPGSYKDREEVFNYDWTASIEVNEGRSTILIGNIVAGYERSGYRMDGEPCPGSANPVQAWQDNEAHGGIYGIHMNMDGLLGCTLIQGFTIWRSFDFGIYFQGSMSLQIANVTLVDNGMGIMPIIYSPPSLSHLYDEDKTVQVQNALIVGTSPDFNCSDTVSRQDTYVRLSREHGAPRPPMGGRSGICWPAFISSHNAGPRMSLVGSTSYNAISGLMTVTDTTFVAFRNVCSTERAVMFMTNPNNEDLQHPIQVKRITMVESREEGKLLIHRPDFKKANPSDCVDMDCDAKKKTLLRDEDGTFLGAVGTVVPQSEFEWDGDARHGLGDYRIPKVMLTYLNGSRIPVKQIAPNKGVIRDSSCTYVPLWQSYGCFGLNYRMLAIESLDADTETRRLSPVAVLGNGYIDLINGPQDHGWCNGYTCQKRLSLFHSVVATGKSFDVYFSSTTPQKLRLMMLNAQPTEAVRVAVYYQNPQRLDVYVNNKLVAPTNAEWNSENTDYTLLKPAYPGMYLPALNSTTHGANYFDPDYKMLYVAVRGTKPVEIRTSPKLFLSFSLPAMTEDEFFGPNLINNLATFLKVPASMIRITKIVREDGGLGKRRKRSTGLSVEVEISKPPVQQTNNSTNDKEAFTELQGIANNLGQAAISGNLSQAVGFNVSSMGIIPPPPPSSDPAWVEVATEEVTREDPVVEKVTSMAALIVMNEPVAGLTPGLLSQQPSLMAVDKEGSCVAVGVTILTVTAVLKDSSGSLVDGLYGNITIRFKGCWANYTDLSISDPGENLTLAFILNKFRASSRSFTVKAVPTTTSSPSTNATLVTDVTTINGTAPPDSPVPPTEIKPTAPPAPTTTTTPEITTIEYTTDESTTDDSDYPSVLDAAGARSPGSLLLLLLFSLLLTLTVL